LDGKAFGAMLNEETLADILSHPFLTQEHRYVAEAADIAKEVGLFSSMAEGDEWSFHINNIGHKYGHVNHERLSSWKRQIKQDIRNQNAIPVPIDDASNITQRPDSSEVNVLHIENRNNIPVATLEGRGGIDVLHAECPITSAQLDFLNKDQCRAYDIVIRHLHDTLLGIKHSPLQMILYGEGGTGKSKVIQTVTEVFKQAGT
jgi:hypothetical protein